MKQLCLTLVSVSLALAPAQAEVKLPAVFGDHMVLQREASVPVWGTASPSEAVTVRFGSSTTTAKTGADGKWMVRLAPLKASATPADLTISGANTITIHDVLVGDVWVCGGQSNMALPVSQSASAKEELPNANHPNLRLLGFRTKPALEPQSNCDATWQLCTPDTAKGFSAAGYFFGKEIADAQKIPVGLIGCNRGATPAQAWTSLETLNADADLKQTYADPFNALVTNSDAAKAAHDKWLANGGTAYQEAVRKFNMEAYAAQQKGLPAPTRPQPPTEKEPPHLDDPTLPSVLYNGNVAPLIPFAIKGVIWYQGESNAGQWQVYRKLFPAMIADWRKHWGEGDFPFIYIQLPNYGTRDAQPSGIDGGWPSLRETQMLSLKTVPNTGMAVTIEIGDGKVLHPPYKAEAGHRLALAARHVAYGEDLLFSGPLYASHKVDGEKIVIKFSNTGTGLKIAMPPVTPPGSKPPPSDELKGFAIAGADGKFVWAKAKIEAPDTVSVWSEQIKVPAAVRYGWGADPEVNLYNSGNLPASPFRTDPPKIP